MEQINFITKATYNGSNQDTLNHVQIQEGYSTNEWLTFVQARNIGRKIKKGSKGVKLIKVVDYFDDKKKEDKKGVKGFTVFNIEQTEKVGE